MSFYHTTSGLTAIDEARFHLSSVLMPRYIDYSFAVSTYDALLCFCHWSCVHSRDDIPPLLKLYRQYDYSHCQCTGYIGEFEIVDDHRSGKIVIQLNGRLNKTGVISPRYNIQARQIESWVNLLLPARGFGIIILVRRHLSDKCAYR